MEYFKDEKEAVDLFIKLFEEGFKNPDLSESAEYFTPPSTILTE